METICCIFQTSACSAIEAVLGDSAEERTMMEDMCTRDGREAMIEGMFDDNFTACAGNCSGAMEAYQELIFIMHDAPSFAEWMSQDGPSKRHIARMREFVCANVEVMTCAATPAGDGYCACDDDGCDGTPSPSPAPSPADPSDPATMLANCDVALAVKVAMQLTVPDPDDFVADPANKLAVEAGIATAAGDIDPSDVEAILSVATSRRLKESLRRLTTGTIDVDATIHTTDAAAAATMVTTVSAIESTAMSTAIAEAFVDAGLDVNVTVEEIGTPVTQTADEAVAEAAAAAASSSSGDTATPGQGNAGGAHQASVAAGVLGILAVFAATTTM